MIAIDGSVKCGGCCEKVHLQIGQYHLKYHMFSIDMGGCDIVLGVEWLHTLVPILMDFKELTMQFQQEGQQYKFQFIQQTPPRSSVPIEWKISSKKVIRELFLKSIPFKQLIHPLCILTSNLSSPSTKPLFPLPMDFPLSMVFMIIPFL
jgi:hypothetical protein